MNRLESKVALITGGASGIGEAIAQRFIAEGAIVHITDLQVDVGRETAAKYSCVFSQQDVTDEAQWPRIIQEVEARHGRLNILINNAGILGPRDAANPENTQLSDWKQIFSVNVEGVFLGCRAAIPALRRAGQGCIVNLSSVAGLMATPSSTAYGASKAAVRQLTKTVAQYCAQQKLNIRCNSVHPGSVRTPLLDKSLRERAEMLGISFEEAVEQMESCTPLGDFTLPSDIAAAVAFLASSDARHITGEQLVVDGGAVHCDTFHMASRPPAPIGTHR